MAIRVVRAVPFDSEDRVLLGLRSKGHSTGHWSLFGGKTDESDVSLLAALTREIDEELVGSQLADVAVALDGEPVLDVDEQGQIWE